MGERWTGSSAPLVRARPPGSLRPIPGSGRRPGWRAHVSIVLGTILALAVLGACGNADTSANEPASTSAEEPSEGLESDSEPYSYGDDPALDELWDACDAGDGNACDELYSRAPSGSEYEQFGDTCGGRASGGTSCAEEVVDPLAGDVDAVCADALAALRDLPTSGADSEDFASQQVAIAQILHDLAEGLASLGAGDLSAAVERYAQANSDLAVAFDQGQFNTDAEYARIEQAGQEVADAASALGTSTCQELASY